MCGRYAVQNAKEEYEKMRADLDKELLGEEFPDRYNVAPTTHAPIIVAQNNKIKMISAYWWLIPHWAKEFKPAYSSFNCDESTILETKLFSPYFHSARCLIPISAFYEWKKIPVKKISRGKEKDAIGKQAMCIRMKDKKTFFAAGVYSIWKNPDRSKIIPTFTIITTTANTLMQPIHHRMPVILSEENLSDWLNPKNDDIIGLKRKLTPFDPDKMFTYPVSDYVNKAGNEGEKCWEPFETDLKKVTNTEHSLFSNDK